MIDKILASINLVDRDIRYLEKEEFLDVLEKINRLLRNFEPLEAVFSDNMVAGDLVSPTYEVRMQIIDYLCAAMSQVDDKLACAAMVYYVLLKLHMFSDGNGRMSRFVYDLISGDLCDDNIDYYFHRDSGVIKNEKNDLERSKGIADVVVLEDVVDELLFNYVKFIPEEIIERYSWITVGHTERSPFIGDILPKHIVLALGEKDLNELEKILIDGYGMNLSTSGLAMLYVCMKRGELDKWVSLSDSEVPIEDRLNFKVYSHPELMNEWGVDDFKEIIRIGNWIKCSRLQCLIDIFLNPSKYINPDTGNTYRDDILTNFSMGKEHEGHKY